MKSENAMANPKNQPTGVFLVRTMLAILSVTVAKVWPGPITGCTTRSGLAMLRSFTTRAGELGVRVPDRRQVARARPRLELGEEAVVPLARLQPEDAAFRVVDVA